MAGSNLIDSRIDELFKKSEDDEYKLFTTISLIIYASQKRFYKSDMYMLAKLIEDSDSAKEYFIKMIDYYDGDVIKLPTKEELRYNQILAIIWYLKDFKGWDWGEIKSFLALPKHFEDDYFSSISFGKKISSIRELLNKEILDQLEMGKFENLKDILIKVIGNE